LGDVRTLDCDISAVISGGRVLLEGRIMLFVDNDKSEPIWRNRSKHTASGSENNSGFATAD
jgi:hypothetical protein